MLSRRSYRAISSSWRRVTEITEHFLSAPYGGPLSLNTLINRQLAVLLAHHTLNRGHRFRDSLPCLNNRAVIMVSGPIEHIGKIHL